MQKLRLQNVVLTLHNKIARYRRELKFHQNRWIVHRNSIPVRPRHVKVQRIHGTDCQPFAGD